MAYRLHRFEGVEQFLYTAQIRRYVPRQSDSRTNPCMSELSIGFSAFRKALLQSEKRRIFGVVAFLLIFACAILIRVILFRSHMNPWGALILIAVVVYELLLLGVVRNALKSESRPPDALLLFSIILELAIPALGIACFSSPRLLPVYRPLATPWVLAFFPLMMLSVFRLNPRVSQIAGVTAAVGYLAGAYYLGWRVNLENFSQHTVTQTAVMFYAAILLATGFIAGMVSGEIRKHVIAALRDAETQSHLRQI